MSLLIGTNSEEWKLFAMMSPPPADEAGLHQRAALVVTDPDEALEVYRGEQPGASVAELECALLTDLVFRIPAVRLADAQAAHAPVHQYLWTWGSPAWGGMIGAAHAIEIPFVFDLVEDQRLHVFVGRRRPQAAGAGHPRGVGRLRPRRRAGRRRPAGVAHRRPTRSAGDGARHRAALASDPQAASRRFWASPGAVMPVHRLIGARQARNSTWAERRP